MSKKVNPALDRRSAIRIGAVGAAATAATVATASNAEAAAGQAVLQGRVNTVGTAGTTLSSNGTAVTLTVKNTGAGAAAFFFGQNNNGFAGGTGSANKYGLSAANTAATAGAGAAMAASGINNTGVLANTNNIDRFAMEAVNTGVSHGDAASGGGLYAECTSNVPAVVAVALEGIPAFIGLGDAITFQGHDLALTAGGAVMGSEMSLRPDVNFTDTISLDVSGEAVVEWPAEFIDSGDFDFARCRAVVSPNSGPMPNLWITTDGAGVISIAGGVPSGTVTFRATIRRTDVWFGGGSSTEKSASTTLDSAKRAVAAAKARASRD